MRLYEILRWIIGEIGSNFSNGFVLDGSYPSGRRCLGGNLGQKKPSKPAATDNNDITTENPTATLTTHSKTDFNNNTTHQQVINKKPGVEMRELVVDFPVSLVLNDEIAAVPISRRLAFVPRRDTANSADLVLEYRRLVKEKGGTSEIEQGCTRDNIIGHW